MYINETIKLLNLYDDVVPTIDKTVLIAWEKYRNEQELTDEEQKVTERISGIIQLFKRLHG